MPEPELRATFPLSSADLADVMLRDLRRQPGLRRQRWLNAIALGCFGLIIASLILVLLPTESTLMRWTLLIACTLTPTVVFSLRWPRTTRLALLRLVQQHHGDGPHTCSITLTPTGVRCEQMGESSEDPWRQITRIHLTGDDIEFVGPMTMTVVRRRAFTTDAERDRFMATAQRLLAEAIGAVA